MYSETPRTIVLAGALGAAEMASIANYCEQLCRGGQVELHLNMSAVTDCHRAGLAGLQALAGGSSKMEVSIDGAHWGQFMLLLSTADILEVQSLCDSVRLLVCKNPPAGGVLGAAALQPRNGAESESAEPRRGA